MEKEKVFEVFNYKTPCCNSEIPDWEEENEYLGNDGNKYPKIISLNKQIGDFVLMSFNGEYSSYDWTEIHYCNKCNVKYKFNNSSI